jgi:DNA ligase 1
MKLLLRWISEKLDGVRAFWNGSMLISRHGLEIKCPEWFIEQFPEEFSLDGELWSGRGTFEMLTATINSKDTIGWKGIDFITFDLPNSGDGYEMRIRNLFKLTLPNHVQIVDVSRCRGNDDIGKYLSRIVDLGGEGMMAMKDKSHYKPMRVEWLLKVKVSISLKLIQYCVSQY